MSSLFSLNSVCAFICNQVNDIAVDEVTPTKQARGDSGKEPKLHRWQNGEKNLGRNQAQLGGQFSSDQTKPVVQFQAAAKSDCAEESSVSCGLVLVLLWDKVFTGDLYLGL